MRTPLITPFSAEYDDQGHAGRPATGPGLLVLDLPVGKNRVKKGFSVPGLGKWGSGNLVRVCSALEVSVDRSLRRRGQFLVAVGALLGALVGVVFGLAVEDAQTSTAVAEPARAAAAVAPPSSQPTAGQPARSGDRADGDGSTGRQRTQSAYRPDQGHGKASKDSRATRDGDWKKTGSRGHDKPSKGQDHAGKSNDQ
jgi:hypothetical protein